MSIMNANSAMVCNGTTPCAFSHSQTQNHLKLFFVVRHSVEGSISSRPCLPDFIHPMSIFLIALAAAVTLWGWAYKLSLYESPQNHPSHLSVAKMWLGPERQLDGITNHVTKPHSWLAPSQFDLTIGAMPPIHRWQSPRTLSEAVFASTGSSFLVGSRSPPSRALSMRSRVVA
jgi:hypothetical protein